MQTIKHITSKRSWSRSQNNNIAYEFVETKGFKNVTEAICCMGREAYHNEFREFKNQKLK